MKERYFAYIDTSEFLRFNLNFSDARLLQMEDWNNQGKVKLLECSILINELLSKVKVKASDSEKNASGFLRDHSYLSALRNGKDIYNVLSGVKAKIVEKSLRERLKAFFKKSIKLNLDGVSVNRILDAYFSVQPPFGERSDKKSEFPDSIVVESLKIFAQSTNVKIFIVSKDILFLESFTGLSEFYTCDKIESLFDQYQFIENESKSNHVHTLLKTHATEIEGYLTKVFKESGFILMDGDGDVVDVGIGNIGIIDFEILSLDENEALIYISAGVQYDLEVSYTDYSCASYDSEDDLYFNTEKVNSTIEGAASKLEVEAKIIYDVKDVKVFRFDIVRNITTEFDVYIHEEY
ncbi:PIN domain-containing protein [Leptospira santarosai]|nr:PIN domain-containing protein [Leptospira santarosai]